MEREQLKDILTSIDIPELRRDISKPENVRWLIRNIPIRNTVSKEVVTALVKILKG